MKTLRTPDECFANLPDYPFEPHYTDVADGDGGTVRVHHIDEGPRDGSLVLCMHGQPSWSYLYRRMIPVLTAAGLRVIAPDLVGYGRSDKPAAREDVSYQREVDWMTGWLTANDIENATLVAQDWGGLIGLRLVAENPDRFERVVIANTGLPAPENVSEERAAAVRKFRKEAPTPTLGEVMEAIVGADPERPEMAFAHWQKWCWETEDLPVGALIAGTMDGIQLTPEEIAAYDAPFPDPSYKTVPRAMPSHVPTLSDDPSLAANLKAWEALSNWEKPFLCAFCDNDPITAGADRPFRERVPGARDRAHPTISGGGHFLQEGRGAELAKIVADFVRST